MRAASTRSAGRVARLTSSAGLRRAARSSPPDPPVTATFSLPVPVQAGGARIPAVSDDWLVKVHRAGMAGTQEEQDAARVKVFGFLRAMAELEPARVASVPKQDLLSALRKARTGVEPGFLTVRDYIEEHWAPPRRDKKPETWRKEEGVFRLYVLLALGDVALREIDHRDVFICARDAKLLNGSPASYNQRRLVLAAFSAMWQGAYEQKHVDRPFNVGGLRLNGSTVKPLAQDALTGPQVKAILGAVDDVRDCALLAACFGTGGRPGEIVRLAWEHVRWKVTERHPHGTIRLSGDVPGVEVR